MFEIRVICDPDDVPKVSTDLALAFGLTKEIRDYPARDGRRRRLYTEAGHRTAPPVQCATCSRGVEWIDHADGWWVHADMDTPDHEAAPATWKDDDRLMQAIAAAVRAYCRTDANGLVRDTAQDIAAVAASVARLLPDSQPEGDCRG
ncbi:hypothetical protein [Streptomyces sp. NPDC052496]|uniref:hypothetical protein n=1 Tax=Streptomyces sp. NPDC052496 TaxID=3154951 RepID=UPI003436A6C6